MEFKKVSIGNYSYGHDTGLAGREKEPDFDRAGDENDVLLNNDKLNDSMNSSVRDEKAGVIPNFNFYDPEFDMHLKDPSHPNHKNIVNFLLHLAICHTIVIQKTKKER